MAILHRPAYIGTTESKDIFMKVMKFGGTSVGSGEKMLHVADIIKKYCEGERVVVVVSAMCGITDQLYAICLQYKEGKVAAAFESLNDLYNHHLNALKEMGLKGRSWEKAQNKMMVIFGQLVVFLTLQRQYCAWGCDHVVSYGERFSSLLLTIALQKAGVVAKLMESTKLIITDNEFGNAKVFMEDTQGKVEKYLFPQLLTNTVVVIPGFFGATRDGKVAILGRGGSDYSATVLAYALDAQEVILWKEVDGVYTKDPKKGNGAKLLSELSYSQASDMARNGAKVLHPAAMEPVMAKNIVVWVKNTFRPDLPGSKIWRGAV